MSVEMLSAQEYSDRYGIHENTVRRLCREKKIDAQKVGGSWRIADEPPGGRAPAEQSEIERLRRDIEALTKWKEKMCEVFSAAM